MCRFFTIDYIPSHYIVGEMIKDFKKIRHQQIIIGNIKFEKKYLYVIVDDVRTSHQLFMIQQYMQRFIAVKW